MRDAMSLAPAQLQVLHRDMERMTAGVRARHNCVPLTRVPAAAAGEQGNNERCEKQETGGENVNIKCSLTDMDGVLVHDAALVTAATNMVAGIEAGLCRGAGTHRHHPARGTRNVLLQVVLQGRLTEEPSDGQRWSVDNVAEDDTPQLVPFADEQFFNVDTENWGDKMGENVRGTLMYGIALKVAGSITSGPNGDNDWANSKSRDTARKILCPMLDAELSAEA
ncbi:hypothetical protein QBC39DRAFT_385907 [Podospora conica]|nr:hypothetical protein QBC39DRAFT_385907 [Schizothecium conicum]